MIADPGVVGPDRMERDVGLVAEERSGFAHHVGVAGQDVHRLDPGERLGKLRPERRNAFEPAGPRLAVVRPRQPGGRVRLPLGRETIAKRGGCFRFERHREGRRLKPKRGEIRAFVCFVLFCSFIGPRSRPYCQSKYLFNRPS